MTHRIFLFVMTASAVFWTGCTSRESLNSQQQVFLMEIPANPVRLSEPVGGILKIRYCRAAAPFDSRFFLYRTDNGLYQQDYYKLFLTPPNEQVGELLRIWLEQSRIFYGVLPSSSSAESNYLLEPHLTALYSDFSDPQSPKTVMKFHAILLQISDSTKVHNVVLEKTYQDTQPLEDNTALKIIKSYGLCLENILAQLQSDLVEVLKNQQTKEDIGS